MSSIYDLNQYMAKYWEKWRWKRIAPIGAIFNTFFVSMFCDNERRRGGLCAFIFVLSVTAQYFQPRSHEPREMELRKLNIHHRFTSCTMLHVDRAATLEGFAGVRGWIKLVRVLHHSFACCTFRISKQMGETCWRNEQDMRSSFTHNNNYYQLISNFFTINKTGDRMNGSWVF